MNCEGVLAVIKIGYFETTVAERNAACLHLRECEACQRLVFEGVEAIPSADIPGITIQAVNALAKDMADPEWM